MAARSWTLEKTARVFLIDEQTLMLWMRRIDEHRERPLVQTVDPVNRYPDFVRIFVRQLKVLFPTMGSVRMAQTLARAGLHLGATTIRRMTREKSSPDGDLDEATSSRSRNRVVAKYPGHTLHVDLTLVPTRAGFWVPWLPFSAPQAWPFCWWVAVAIDQFSRRLVGLETQLTTYTALLPAVRTLGVIYDPDQTGAMVSEAGEAAKKLGLQLLAVPIASYKEVAAALRKMLGKIDALWMLPDTTVVTRQSFKFFALTALKNRLPLLTMSEVFVEAIQRLCDDPSSPMGKERLGRVLTEEPVDHIPDTIPELRKLVEPLQEELVRLWRADQEEGEASYVVDIDPSVLFGEDSSQP